MAKKSKPYKMPARRMLKLLAMPRPWAKDSDTPAGAPVGVMLTAAHAKAQGWAVRVVAEPSALRTRGGTPMGPCWYVLVRESMTSKWRVEPMMDSPQPIEVDTMDDEASILRLSSDDLVQHSKIMGPHDEWRNVPRNVKRVAYEAAQAHSPVRVGVHHRFGWFVAVEDDGVVSVYTSKKYGGPVLAKTGPYGHHRESAVAIRYERMAEMLASYGGENEFADENPPDTLKRILATWTEPGTLAVIRNNMREQGANRVLTHLNETVRDMKRLAENMPDTALVHAKRRRILALAAEFTVLHACIVRRLRQMDVETEGAENAKQAMNAAETSAGGDTLMDRMISASAQTPRWPSYVEPEG